MDRMNLKKHICCEYENDNIFGKECTVVDSITHYEYSIIDIEGVESIIYKGNVCNNKIDILNKIIFKLSDYSDLYIVEVRELQDLFEINNVEITVSAEEVNKCINFKDLLHLAERIMEELF